MSQKQRRWNLEGFPFSLFLKGKERKGKELLEMSNREGERKGNDGNVNVGSRFPLSFWEVTVASTVLLGFVLGLLGVYLTMPPSDYSFLKLPRTLEDLQILRFVFIFAVFCYIEFGLFHVKFWENCVNFLENDLKGRFFLVGGFVSWLKIAMELDY